MQEMKQEVLQTEEGLEFLFYNASFLLAFADIAEKILTAFEKEMGCVTGVGRDKQASFRFNQNMLFLRS